MSAIRYEEDREEHWDPEQEDTVAMPGRPRRQFFNRRSAALLALVTCAAGFYAGIRVEKGQVSSSSSTARTFTPPALGSQSTRSATGANGSRSSSFPGGGFPGAALAGGNASIGTISSVDGTTIYLSDTSGNTVKVTLSSATKITKSLSVGKRSLHPGDSVVIRGLKNNKGTVSATSISDSGASSTSSDSTGSNSTGSNSTGSNSNASSGSSAVNSLFGGGGGG
jgi:hypothetical protein